MTERIFPFVTNLISEYGTRDPFELCRLCGVSVVFAELPPSVDGFYMETEGKQAIVLSNSLSGIRKHFCAAHELGHALLHRSLNSIFISENTQLPVGRYEREADIFAAALVLGDENSVNAEQLCKAVGIPKPVIESYLSYIYKSA